MLLVNNLIPFNRKDAIGCFTWGSYVAVEVQLFIFLPFIMIIYRYSKMTAVIILLILMLLGSAICGYVLWLYDIVPGYLYSMDVDVISAYGIKPYVRIDSYCMGVLIAISYEKIKWY